MSTDFEDTPLARFLSPDPFMVGPRTSQALNRYSYVLNNPLRYIGAMQRRSNWLTGYPCDSGGVPVRVGRATPS